MCMCVCVCTSEQVHFPKFPHVHLLYDCSFNELTRRNGSSVKAGITHTHSHVISFLGVCVCVCLCVHVCVSVCACVFVCTSEQVNFPKFPHVHVHLLYDCSL